MNLYDFLAESIPEDHCRQVGSKELIKSSVDKGFYPNNILDFGCGTGQSVEYFKSLLPTSRWTGVDIEFSPEVNARKDSNAHFVTYDGYELPFANNYFDLVYSSQVLEHVRKPELALQEVARVLTDEGLFIGQTSQFEAYHSYSYWNFTVYGFKRIVEDAGMKLLEFRPSIDGFTLMNRSYTLDTEKYNKYFGEESPINKEIEAEELKKGSSVKMINYKKLIGQFCFVCSLA
jgi:ubiquinone/menaquinone biosynthesis C-methylase UbiE